MSIFRFNNLILFLFTILIGVVSSAAPYAAPIVGDDAKALYSLVADDSNSDVDLFVSCSYIKTSKGFMLQLCIVDDGYINSPVREMVSNILLANRKPISDAQGEYIINAHYKCSNAPQYSCTFEDESDYINRPK
jgi:hypothetical protein